MKMLRAQGSLARESLPAAGSQYATDVQRAELRMLFRRYGCHHCGKRFGQVIADHQPPNKTVYGACAGAWVARPSRRLTHVTRRQHRGCGGGGGGGQSRQGQPGHGAPMRCASRPR
jgi:hypothetical protein